MSVFDHVRNVVSGPQSDEVLYELVVDELEAGNLRKGLWAKACALEGFDDAKAKASYIKMRVAHLRRDYSQD